jgi:hypothetical protein
MLATSEFVHQASKFNAILSNADDSEILAYADELLLFLNRLRDFLHDNIKVQIPISSIDDIIYGLESNPTITLQDQSIRARLLNLFTKLTLK